MKKMESQVVRFGATNSNAEENVSNGSMNNCQPRSAAIYSTDVIVEVDIATHNSGSSAVTTRNITKYPWEQAYLPGNLVAVHCSENFIAYAIKAPKTYNGMVRIICRNSGVRGLIKNIPGLVKDIGFANLTNKILLGFVDHYGTVFVYEINEETETLRTDLLLEIKHCENTEQSEYQRLIWCPYIPDEEEDQEDDEDNFAYLLLTTNGPEAMIWNIAAMLQSYNGPNPLVAYSGKTEQGRQYLMEKHSAPIIDAAFSPDGTALATAGLDGLVKFSQVYLSDEDTPPRCLHEWKPHDGKPVSCLFFLDNHRNPPSPEVQFWKYAVTGAYNNTEIKVWSCETWKCNQTLIFQSTKELKAITPQHALKAAIDPSSKYLILSDIYRRVLYVLILNTADGTKCGAAKIFSLTELPIQFPIVSMSITNAEWKPYKRWKHEHLADTILDEFADDEENDNMDVVEGLVIKSVLINTQSLQDATIRFQPMLSSSVRPMITSANDISQEESIIIRDGLTDLSIADNLSSSMDLLQEITVTVPEKELESNSALLLNFPPTTQSDPLDGVPPALPSPVTNTTKINEPVTMNLLTPESFSSPGRVEEPKKESNLAELEKISRKTPSPSEDLKSAAISLLMQSAQSSTRRCKTPEIPNILDSVVSGSRVSPTMNSLPPPPRKQPSPLPGKEGAPLATSELAPSAEAARLSSGETNAPPMIGFASSSTSSPSLEVQQILHSHNNKNDEEDPPAALLDLATPSSSCLPPPVVSNTLSCVPSIVAASKNDTQRSLQELMNMASNATPEKVNGVKNAASLIDMLGPLKPFSCSELEADIGNRREAVQQNGQADASQSTKSKELENLYQKTHSEIESLKDFIKSSNDEHNQRMRALLDHTTTLVGQFDKNLKSTQILNNKVEEMQKSQTQLQDQLPNIFAATIRPMMEGIVRQEIRSAISPALLNKCFEPLRGQISTELRVIVGSNERIVSESFNKIVYSGNFSETLSTAVCSTLASSVQNACRESYNKIVLPGLNAVTSQVFTQLNDAFTRGTKEYIHHVETESQTTRQSCIDAINKTTKSLDASATSLAAQSSSISESMQKSMTLQSSLSDTLGDRLRHLVREEVVRAMQEHHVAMEARVCARSQTPAPAPHTPTNPKIAQQQVQNLISQGQFNIAFKQALSASDLSLVVFVCERINPQQLFSQTPCPLSQDVLLSLVNQLSHDLTTFTDLKTKYLEESVMNLDISHPVTREHMKSVLQGFQRNLTKHVSLYPNHKKLKMLLLAVNHLAASTE